MSLDIPVNSVSGDTGYVRLIDTPISSSIGNLINDQDEVQGTITYATGKVEVTPKLIKRVFKQVFTPMNVYGTA